MNRDGLNKLFWGFFFVMLNFRLMGFDIFPDIIGYIFFAVACSSLASRSAHFETAGKYNIVMLILSLFNIYQAPAQGGGIQLGSMGLLSMPIAIVSFIINLLLIYNIFMGIKEIAERSEQYELAQEALNKWEKYKVLQIAFLFSFIVIFIPILALIYIIVLFVAGLILTINILGFIRRCGEHLID